MAGHNKIINGKRGCSNGSVSGQPKLLSCLFDGAVLCSFVKREGRSGVLTRCFKCPTYLRFCREMEAEEDAFFEMVERVRRGEDPYG